LSAARHRAQAFCARFGLRAPILLALTAGASPAPLAAAVADAGGLGALGTPMTALCGIHAWVAAFRGRSNGGFQIDLWIPDPPPGRDAARKAQLREALKRVGGVSVPDAGPGPFLPDFGAHRKAPPTTCLQVRHLDPRRA